ACSCFHCSYKLPPTRLRLEVAATSPASKLAQRRWHPGIPAPSTQELTTSTSACQRVPSEPTRPFKSTEQTSCMSTTSRSALTTRSLAFTPKIRHLQIVTTA